MEISDLIESINIIDYISQYTEITQRGKEYFALSPLTNERTPSFTIDPDKNVFYDFSSGIGGNVLTFTKAIKKCNTYRAVEILKEYAGVNDVTFQNLRLSASSTCKKFRPKEKKEKICTAEILPKNCMDKYMFDVNKFKDWIDEGITVESLENFNVKYDPLTRRIVYPIHDISGNIVNIGGRTTDPNWKEKNLRKYSYYQSWGSINTIYGYFENLDSIISKKELILFEGAKSVMKAYGWGFDNCGAILTSHLSENQMKILLKLGVNYNVKIILALDKDVDIRKDHNLNRLKSFVNVYYLKDVDELLEGKDAPVDKGVEVFKKLYDGRRKL